MSLHIRKEPTIILNILLLTIGITFSSSGFTDQSGNHKRTNSDASINHTTDSHEQNKPIAGLKKKITSLRKALDKVIADLEEITGPTTPKKVGDLYGGGIIFYIDSSGMHGLIASLADQSDGIPWVGGDDIIYAVARADGFGVGHQNTTLIIASHKTVNLISDYAAKLAMDYSVQDDGISACTGLASEICHKNWYLPSASELALLYSQKDLVGGFAQDTYWSSSEVESTNDRDRDTYGIYFASNTSKYGIGFHNSQLSKTDNARVRAIRSF
ncbi:hypothetical protein C8R27_14117 [Nitrosomonas ureae]|uniref:hypothetical protein n=1 Tax=Nitrosomonas ureae TaxID=44577 RepID=UPI000D75A89A|nr:hypothetical protein [Nitrosomonas ureae]PXX08947.1 hypothetical protein C8R27_14117 [Nitrosomonas ureae]